MSISWESFLLAWSWQPGIVLGLALALDLYVAGWLRLRGRGHGRAAPKPWRLAAYVAGLATIGIALCSPIDTFDDRLFFLHMLQHQFLLIVAPALIWLGAPLLPMLWAWPRRPRTAIGKLFAPASPVQRIGYALTRPPVAVVLYLAVIAIWHVPALYDAAQGRSLVHDLEHLSFLGVGLLYWWPLTQPDARKRLEYAVLYLAAPGMEGGLLGGWFTFARQPLYSVYERAERLWGISPLLDQQIGGILMWALGGVFYAGALFVFLLALLRSENEAAQRQHEQAAPPRERVGV